MIYSTITRSALVEAIDKAIESAAFHGLSDSQAERLREVGRTTDRVTARSYFGGAGCPIKQAGMIGEDAVDKPNLGVRIIFAKNFDTIVSPYGDVDESVEFEVA